MMLLNMRPLPFGFGDHMPHEMKVLVDLDHFICRPLKDIPIFKLDGIPILRFFNRIHKVPTIVVRPY